MSRWTPGETSGSADWWWKRPSDSSSSCASRRGTRGSGWKRSGRFCPDPCHPRIIPVSKTSVCFKYAGAQFFHIIFLCIQRKTWTPLTKYRTWPLFNPPQAQPITITPFYRNVWTLWKLSVKAEWHILHKFKILSLIYDVETGKMCWVLLILNLMAGAHFKKSWARGIK